MGNEGNIAQVVEVFCGAAIEKGDFAEPTRDHALHKAMAKAVATLRSFGAEGNAAFRSLLTHDSPHVRSWVAAELLAAGEETARPVLEGLTSAPGLIAIGAATVLREYAAGRLRSPFGNSGA